MQRLFAMLLFVLIVRGPAEPARQGQGVFIESPQPGEAVQGSVAITGGTAVEGFLSAELSFGYAKDQTQTWFFITEMEEPLASGKLADWDTTTLTDGTYTLRLVVTRIDGSQLPFTSESIRVRNYTAVETSTPTLAPTSAPQPSATPTLTLTPSPTPVPATPTPLPPNPAEISPGELGEGLTRGVAGAVVAFAALGLYLSARRHLRR